MLRKQQWMVVAAGSVLLFSLFVFGRFTPAHDHAHEPAETSKPASSSNFDFNQYMSNLKKDLTPSQSAYLSSLEDAISRGDLISQKKQNFQAMSDFWRDSARAFTPYIYYLGEKAKLENSEKSMNFAAHSMLEELRGIQDPALKSWMANQANQLFKKSLELNPNNDSTIVGQGSTFFFGAEGAPMEGIMNIRKVVERDPNNVFAQFMLGYGGMISGQNDKAIERFLKVTSLEPENTESIFLLAEVYERDGKKKEAKAWYEKGLTKVKNPDLVKALEEKINSLK
ncbi:MAG: tetratricopeptide repeat protein [Chitinophagaceae bacterium]|jgi:tetratricopeptide (TPR) repeat protein